MLGPIHHVTIYLVKYLAAGAPFNVGKGWLQVMQA